VDEVAKAKLQEFQMQLDNVFRIFRIFRGIKNKTANYS